MFVVLPDRIATDQLQTAGGRIQGLLALGRLRRLAKSIDPAPVATDTVTADLEYLPDRESIGRLHGSISVHLKLRCERCSGTMDWPIDAQIELFVVPHEAAAGELPGDAEYVVAAGSLNVLELIEEELLLALPLIARHPQGTPCGDQAGPRAESGERESPFAILKNLKT